MFTAITRQVSPAIANCELTHLQRQAIDVELARKQHQLYQDCLTDIGCQVHELPVEPNLPDSVFVEDTAIMLDELAVMTRPGAPSRRLETRSVAGALETYRELVAIQDPATLDGGDVLHVDQTLYVGISGRSNQAGVDQLRALLHPFGYTVTGVRVTGCLHLKSAVTQVAANTLLINRNFVDPGIFSGMKLIDVDPSEPLAGNALLVGQTVVYPTDFPATRKRLEGQGVEVRTVDMSELAKAEGGVTCCSLIFGR